MEAGLLFSGGKDSALAATMLARDYGTELNTCVFDPDREVPQVRAAAAFLGLPFRKRVLGRDLLDEAVDLLLACGYPNDAIDTVHRAAVEMLAGDYAVVADGTRRDDRVPGLDREERDRLAPEPDDDLVQEADLVLIRRTRRVHEAPDDARAGPAVAQARFPTCGWKTDRERD